MLEYLKCDVVFEVLSEIFEVLLSEILHISMLILVLGLKTERLHINITYPQFRLHSRLICCRIISSTILRHLLEYIRIFVRCYNQPSRY